MPEWFVVPEWLIAFLIALTAGTFVEYWAHRMMHSWLLRKKHAEHHRDGWGQGWFWEFLDYFSGTVFVLPVGFLYSLEAGIGFTAGGPFFPLFSAYSPQLPHQKPEALFLLPPP